MRKTLFAIATLLASAVAFEATAQSVYVERKQISSAAARKMVDACLAFAEKNNILVGVAVVGIDGVLIDFHAMQGAVIWVLGACMVLLSVLQYLPRYVLIGFAAVLIFEHNMWDGFRPVGSWGWLWAILHHQTVIPLGGGYPIKVGNETIGGVGVSGNNQAGYEACAKAGVDKVADQLK